MKTRCRTESDGFHQHEYQIWEGGWATTVITDHLHSWNAEHFATWPDSKPVDVWRGQNLLTKHDSLAEAWAEYGSGDIPAVDCKKDIREGHSRKR